MGKSKKLSKEQVSKRNGFRSGLEETIQKFLIDNNIASEYEKHIIQYVKPETKHKYTPDFCIKKKDGSNMFIETKGRFVLVDRQKHILLKSQYPEIDIRFVFQNSRIKISKSSKTTYADWCIKHGFKFADKVIPIDWLNED